MKKSSQCWILYSKLSLNSDLKKSLQKSKVFGHLMGKEPIEIVVKGVINVGLLPKNVNSHSTRAENDRTVQSKTNGEVKRKNQYCLQMTILPTCKQ